MKSYFRFSFYKTKLVLWLNKFKKKTCFNKIIKQETNVSVGLEGHDVADVAFGHALGEDQVGLLAHVQEEVEEEDRVFLLVPAQHVHELLRHNVVT